jgi:hypothetical protein
MPDFNSWIGLNNKSQSWLNDIENNNRAVHATHRIISDRPVLITIFRKGVALPVQTVRIELSVIAPDVNLGPAGRGHDARGYIVGYKGHPDYPDFDVKSGDVFTHDSTKYEVRFILPETAGRTEAWVVMFQ